MLNCSYYNLFEAVTSHISHEMPNASYETLDSPGWAVGMGCSSNAASLGWAGGRRSVGWSTVLPREEH